MTKHASVAAAAALCLPLLLAEARANAGGGGPGGPSPGGVGTGQLTFYQDSGNDCREGFPFNMVCDDARYKEADRDVYQPFPDAKVALYAFDPATGLLSYWVESSVDSNGTYVIGAPVDPDNGDFYPATLQVHFKHKDGRFRVTDNGTTLVWQRGVVMRAGHVVDHGQAKIGTPASPDRLANAYWSGWMVWEHVFKQAALLFQDFTDVEIATEGTCNTGGSCASWSNKRVTLAPGKAFTPATVMHELGHIASGQSHVPGYVYGGSYCYPDASCPPGASWGLFEAEWASAQFEEAIASFFAVAGLYPHDGRDARFCSSGSPCGFTIGPNEGFPCSEDHNRYPIHAIRFLWDKYDSFNETGDSVTDPIWNFIGGMANFPPGDCNGCTNEAFLWDRDGRSLLDFDKNAIQPHPELFDLHCGSVGD